MLPSDFYETRLAAQWRIENEQVFRGALLVPPTIVVVNMNRHAADWNPASRLLRVGRNFVETQPWLVVVEVLKHEMAHQYVSDVLGVEDETAHGPAFRMICERHAIDARATGVPRTEKEEHLIDRIKKLFALGGSPNENESRAALNHARRLLHEHGLEMGDLVARDPEAHGVAILGPVICERVPEHRRVVAHILSAFFRVLCIFKRGIADSGTWGLQLEICGRRSDLAIAEHVHNFLCAEGERLWARCVSDAVRTRDKLDFLDGTMRGFLESLTEEEARKAAECGDATGLVRSRMATDLQAYFALRNPSVRKLRGSRRIRGDMFVDGLAAGRRIKIARPLSSSAGPKLLTRAASQS